MDKVKILFIGISSSSHTTSWIDLLNRSEISVQLFNVSSTYDTIDWEPTKYHKNIKENINEDHQEYGLPEDVNNNDIEENADKISIQSKSSFKQKIKKILIKFPRFYYLINILISPIRVLIDPSCNIRGVIREALYTPVVFQNTLIKTIKKYKPDIIHTLGIDPASFLYLDTLCDMEQVKKPIWVVQARGGPDIALNRFLPEYSHKIKQILHECDYLIADNQQNYEYAIEMGLKPEKIYEAGIVPGTGGINIDQYSEYRKILPSQRSRTILWPKAYENVQSKAFPVFEAIRLSWAQIKPCKIWMTAAIQKEVYVWFEHLPEEIKENCILVDRIPRDDLIELLGSARILLIPSMSDGIPNSMYEAMACGTFPIVSPIETISPLVEDRKNVLFANNLNSQEISDAIIRAMNDDDLVDGAVGENIKIVSKYADRERIRKNLLSFYHMIASKKRQDNE